MVSIHALLAECDSTVSYSAPASPRFNPRTPCGVRRFITNPENASILFQSTHSLRSATEEDGSGPRHRHVSIHALLAECDAHHWTSERDFESFNPRTPCGVRPGAQMKPGALYLFQSTHSLRSATSEDHKARNGETVSIHALLAECDAFSLGTESMNMEFQSTHSLRSATNGSFTLTAAPNVSIHALLAECDPPCVAIVAETTGFNPRTPCGVRRIGWTTALRWIPFQSTHSLRSATRYGGSHHRGANVSIHALLAECDCAQPYTLLLNKANHTLRQPP